MQTGAEGRCLCVRLTANPVTLYAEQWERLFGFIEEVKSFIKDHPGLARKQRS